MVWVVEEGLKFDVGVSSQTAREIPSFKFSKVQTSNLYPARKRLVEKISDLNGHDAGFRPKTQYHVLNYKIVTALNVIFQHFKIARKIAQYAPVLISSH